MKSRDPINWVEDTIISGQNLEVSSNRYNVGNELKLRNYLLVSNEQLFSLFSNYS